MPLALILITSLVHRNKGWQWLRWKQHPFCLIPQLAFFLPFCSYSFTRVLSPCSVSLFLLPESLCLTSPQRKTYTAPSPWYSWKPKEREMQMSYFTVINPRKINLILNGSAHDRWVRGSWPPFFFSSNIYFTLVAGGSMRRSPQGALPNLAPYSIRDTEQSYSAGISINKQNLAYNCTYERGWGIRIWPSNYIWHSFISNPLQYAELSLIRSQLQLYSSLIILYVNIRFN